jgi:molybdopterin synthase catalytic subunit
VKSALFVFTSSAHRKAAIDACEETVERIKLNCPVWGKEILRMKLTPGNKI